MFRNKNSKEITIVRGIRIKEETISVYKVIQTKLKKRRYVTNYLERTDFKEAATKEDSYDNL